MDVPPRAAAAAVALASVAALTLGSACLAGCRPSPALTEIVYDDFASSTNDEAPVSSIDNAPGNEDRDDDLSPKETDDDSTDPRERERRDAVLGEGEDDGAAPGLVDDPDSLTDRDAAAADASEADEGRDDGEELPEEAEELPEEVAGTVAAGMGAGEVPSAGPSGESPRQVVDAAGRLVDVPAQAQRVAAVGEAAVIVGMLGGGDALVATSESYLEAVAGTSLEPGASGGAGAGASTSGASGSSGAPGSSDASASHAPSPRALWGGSGASPLSDDAFAELLALGPDVCFEVSGTTTFSEGQIVALGEAGVAYAVLPSLSTDEGIRLAVTVAGEVLGDRGDVDCAERARDYLAFCDRAVALVSSRVDAYLPDGIDYATGETVAPGRSSGGEMAVFLSGWDAGVTYSLHDDAYATLSGAGLPVTLTGYRASPVTHYLSLAGVGNSAALKENNYSLLAVKLRYVCPVASPNKTLSTQGGSAATYDARYVFTTAGGVYLGEEGFTTVIAANPEVGRGVGESPLWKDYGVASSATGLTNGYGFTDQNGDVVITTVHGPYDVAVMPTGVGSWANGSVESVLVAPWAAWRVRGALTREEVGDLVSEFYATFYGTDLSGERLDAFLDGEGL